MEFQKRDIEVLLTQILASLNNGVENVMPYLAEDIIVQLPYSRRSNSVMDRQQYFQHLSRILPMMENFKLRDHRLYATDEPGTYWATADLECRIIPTGKIYQQLNVLHFSVNKEMKLVRYYEYGNPLKIAEAMRPFYKLFWHLLKTKIAGK